jgi:hypothetical protein
MDKANETPAAFIMVPQADGTYALRKYEVSYGYVHVAYVNNEKEAKTCIANLQRPTIEL